MIGASSNLVIRKNSIYTVSSYGKSVYGERVSRNGGTFLRQWDPKRSKLAALLQKRKDFFPFKYDSRVLYLGAASGTTLSHISDLANKGIIYGVEVSYEPFLKLLSLAEDRNNIIPILEDARALEKFSFMIDSPDVIYQDVSQRDQVSIFNQAIHNWPSIKFGFLVLKIRSISFSRKESEILKTALDGIRGMNVVHFLDLRPFHLNTFMICLRRNQ